MTEIISVEQFRAMNQGKTGPRPRQGKYNAQRTEVGGIEFDSKKEAHRYQTLKLLEREGSITALSRQVRFKLEGGSYTADFVYLNCDTMTWVVEDAKGARTPAYRRSKRAMKERYGIEILET